MDRDSTRRFMLVTILCVLACLAGVGHAQKAAVGTPKPPQQPVAAASPQQKAPVPAQPAVQPPVAAQETADEDAADEAAESGVPVQVKLGATPINPINPKAATAGAPKAPVTLPPIEDAEEEEAEPATQAPPQGKGAPKAATVPVGGKSLPKATVAPVNPSDDEEADEEAPAVGTQQPKAVKVNEKEPAKATVPPPKEAEEEEESAEEPSSASPIPKKATVAGAKLAAVPLVKATVAPVGQDGAAEESGESGDAELVPEDQAIGSNQSIAIGSNRNVTKEAPAKNLAAAQGLPPKTNGTQIVKALPSDEEEESGEEEAAPTTIQAKKGTTAKPKAGTPTKVPVSEEEDGSASGDESEAEEPVEPAVVKNPTSSAPTGKPKGATAPRIPQPTPTLANVPGGPSFQPLEGGAIPPVLARANLAASAALNQQPGVPKGAITAHSLSTPPVAAVEGEEEGEEEEEASADELSQGLVTAVNVEYADALKNLTKAGVLAESEYENKHLSDLFALLLENLVNANPSANEKTQRDLVHQAAVEFQDVFKAKAASTKNISEIVRLLNEQIIVSPLSPLGAGTIATPSGTLLPFDPSRPVSSPALVGGSPKAPTKPALVGGSTAEPDEEESEGEESEGESSGGDPQAVNLQTVHLLQNANGLNKTGADVNATVGKGNFPNPPVWKSSGEVSSAAGVNGTESGEVESAEGSEEAVNGTESAETSQETTPPAGPTFIKVPAVGNTSIVPIAEPSPTGAAGSTKLVSPVAEPQPTAEPTANNATVSSAEVTDSSSESDGNATTTSEESSGESQSPGEVSSSSSTNGGNITTESFWAGGESSLSTPVPEPEPTGNSSTTKAAGTPKSDAVVPWSFKIVDPQTEWDSELANKESFQFKTLYGSLIADLKTIFQKLEPQRFVDVSIKQFSQGSVIVEGQTELKERVESGQLLDSFLKQLKDQENKIGGRIIDPVSITFDGRPSTELARAGSNAVGTPAWVIGLSVGGVLLAAIVIAAALIIVRLLRNRRSASIASVDAEMDKSSPIPQHIRPLPGGAGHPSKRGGYDAPYGTRADNYYRYYQTPYMAAAPGAVARPIMAPAPPNYYSPYYHQQQQQNPYSYW